jgi:PAS domain S-box-containing protein
MLQAVSNTQVAQTDTGWLALVNAVERLSAAKSVADIIEIVRSTARAISGADGVCFVLRDGELCHYVEEDAIAPLWKGRRFPLTACISGWCMLNDSRAVIPDIYTDPRIPYDAYRPTFVKSMIMAPVKTTRPIAAIGAYWAQKRRFSDEEIALIEALARSTAAAIASVQLHQSLIESERRLNVALDAGGLGAFEFDLVTGALDASPMCKTIFAHADEDHFSLNDLLRAVHGEDRPRVRAAFDAAHPEIDLEFHLHGADGEDHIVEMRGRVVRDAEAVALRVSGVVRDITERRKAKERLEALQADVAQIRRLNEMGQMVSALAHELNQPLAAAGNYLHAAKRLMSVGEHPNQKAIDALSKAEAQFTRTGAVIQRIRGFAGKGKISRVAEEMSAVIGEAVELALLDPRAKGVEIVLELEDGLPRAKIDKVQIQQVLLNLLRNAFEAMAGRPARQIFIGARRSGGMIEIRVADSGPGLAPEIAEKLFQPFQTTKPEGMGVGLSLCRSLIEAHDGKLWSAPEDEMGAVFRFTLPLAG